MSRIGKKIIQLNNGTTVTVTDNIATVTGKFGTRELTIPNGVNVEINDNVVTTSAKGAENFAQWGLFRSLLSNEVVGLTDGFVIDLEIKGVGYRAQADGVDGLTLSLGYSHHIKYKAPEGITFEVPELTKIKVKGNDKQLVGQVAAKIRSFRSPEPYKGKGIKLSTETILRKAGKAAKGR